MADPNNPASDVGASLAQFSAQLAALVAKGAPHLVSVLSHRSRASGFVWKPGLIVTASEALAEEGEIAVVLPGGERVAATLAGRDPTTDVALLRIERKDVPPVTLASEPVAPGALAVTVGARDGVAVAAFGIVSVSGPAWRSLRGGEIDARIELDTRLSRAAEGGLAFDASGRAFGMAVFGPRRRVLIIPSATIERVAAKLEAHGRVARGYVGLGLQPVKLDDGGIGVMAMSVDPKGPAAAAGIRQGDVIVALNGQPIRAVPALWRALGPDSVGTTVTLSLRRAGEPVEVTVTVAERPPA